MEQQAQRRSAWFRGERLQLVREFNGLTQKEFGTLVGVSHALISDLEKAKRQPTDELLEGIADKTGFLPSFFLEKIQDPFLETECSFRHRRSTPEKFKAQIRAHATVLGMIVTSLRSKVRFPAFNVPAISAFTATDIEDAASSAREHWKLGPHAPIHQVGRAIELAGVIIIPAHSETKKIDAFSRCGPNSLIFLNQSVESRPSRWNFDLAHEYGHLVMHRDIPTGSLETEQAADLFASCFLMPREAFSKEFKSRFFSWDHVFELKRRWHTSAAAIIRRARDLSLVDDQAYRRAFQYMSAKRWRTDGEPFEPKFQEPEIFGQALDYLAHKPHAVQNLCNEVGLTQNLFIKVIGVGNAELKLAENLLKFPRI